MTETVKPGDELKFSYRDQVVLQLFLPSSTIPRWIFPLGVRCEAPGLDFGQSLVEPTLGGGKFVTFKTDKV